MKVAILTTVHPENDVRIYHKQALCISKQHEVTLIAPKMTDQELKLVNYVPLNRSGSRLKRLMTQFDAYKIIKNIRPDVIHMHDPELIFLGIILKVHGYKIIWDVHENLPAQILSKHWVPRLLRRPVSVLASALELLAGILFDHIITATSSIGRSFPSRKTSVIQNFPILGEMSDGHVQRFAKDIPVFFHGGGLTKIRGIEQIIEAIYILNNDLGYPAILRLVGKFESQSFEEACINSRGWRYVEYHKWVERERLKSLLDSADAGIVTFLPVPNHVDSQPNKIFEYMSASMPIIISDFPLWKEVIGSENPSGITVNPNCPSEIAEAMRNLIDAPEQARSMGEQGLKKVVDQFNWGAESKKLENVYTILQRGFK